MLQFITPAKPIEGPKLYKAFQTATVAKATLRITGLGLYRAVINGKRVGKDYLTPGFNDYDAYLRWQTYDVTDLLAKDNLLEVTLGNGWYKGLIGLQRRKNVWGNRFLLAAELVMEYADGATAEIDTDDSWLAVQSPVTDSGIYDGETRDDTIDPGEPVPCKVIETDYQLEAPVSPAIRCVEVLKPTLIVTPRNEQVLDFGQNAAGIMSFINRTPKGTRIIIETGEVLQQGCFYRENLRTADSRFTYVSDGVEKEVEPLFTFFGFRYIRVQGMEQVRPEDFTMKVLSCDLRPTLKVETDHSNLNQLMHNSFWGQRSNFVDVPTDCPQRDERMGWTADTQVYVNTACYQMDCKDFYRKFMKDMRADQTMYFKGNIPMYSPSMKRETNDGGAVWADAGTIIPWNVYMNYGDTALLRENYPMMRDYAEVLITQDRSNGFTHLVFPYFTFGDWLAQDGLTSQSVFGGTENAYIQGIYYLNSVQLTAKAAEALGEAADAECYGHLAEEIRAALIDEYITLHGRLAVDTQTAYVLALRYGVYRDKEKLMEGFRRRLRRDFYRITSGFTGAPLMIPVLLDNGMTEQAYRMLLTEEFPGWMYAVKLGATTVWERWNSLDENGNITGISMNSLNHYAYGSVCEAVYSRIMGLQNAAPGWKKAKIAPKLTGEIRHSAISYDSAAGQWQVGWDILEDGQVTLTAVVPAGCTAEVVLPDHPEAFAATVSDGTYTWTWQPTKDYLHPWSGETMLMDLQKVPAALEVLKKMLPSAYDCITANDREGMLHTVRECFHDDVRNNPDQMALYNKVDAALKQLYR